ncbi:hypothetical protein VNO78_32994 [Psophocarpus tetragonolobus]|uniref:Uncharacterized protein n=1 Tax=Psophocarpus tetragonolobus TaxID=3891 RepID=A0AAN9P3D4_PSOTE
MNKHCTMFFLLNYHVYVHVDYPRVHRDTCTQKVYGSYSSLEREILMRHTNASALDSDTSYNWPIRLGLWTLVPDTP